MNALNGHAPARPHVHTPEAPGPVMLDDNPRPNLWANPGDAEHAPAWCICAYGRMKCLDGSYTPTANMILRSFHFEDDAVHVLTKWLGGQISAQGMIDYQVSAVVALQGEVVSKPPRIPYRKRLAQRRKGPWKRQR